MSTKRKIWSAVLLVLAIGVVLRFVLPDIGRVGSPLVSVRAEELFHIGPYTVTNSLLLSVLITLGLIFLSAMATRRLRANSEAAMVAPTGLQNFMELLVEQLYNVMAGISPKYVARFFVIVATIFFMLLPSNWSGLVPGVGSVGLCLEHHPAPGEEAAAEHAAPAEGEHATSKYSNTCANRTDAYTTFHPFFRAPSADLNLTLALALISFTITEFWGFRVNGFGYLKKFFNFTHGPIQFFVGIIELISEFARIVSFTFRLFGNIFAGEVVLLVMSFLFPYLLSLPFYALELFVGFIQAFVFAMLTMAFIDMASESHSDHDEAHHEHAGTHQDAQAAQLGVH